jgi:hypothetical protein
VARSTREQNATCMTRCANTSIRLRSIPSLAADDALAALTKYHVTEEPVDVIQHKVAKSYDVCHPPGVRRTTTYFTWQADGHIDGLGC